MRILINVALPNFAPYLSVLLANGILAALVECEARKRRAKILNEKQEQ